MNQRMWNLKLTVPGEPERTKLVPESEMAATLRGLMSGAVPADADLAASELPVARREAPVAQAA